MLPLGSYLHEKTPCLPDKMSNPRAFEQRVRARRLGGIESKDHVSPGGTVLAARSVLIYRIGSLGDTLVALPALWAIREHFKDARITLLCDQHAGKNYVVASDLLS